MQKHSKAMRYELDRNGWYIIYDENDDKVAEYRKGELVINDDYPLTSEKNRELQLLILNID